MLINGWPFKTSYCLIKFIKSLNLSPGRLSIIHNLISIYINTTQKTKLKNLIKNYNNLREEKVILYGKAFSCYFENNYQDSITFCKKIIEFEEFKFSIQDLLASNYKKQKKFLDALKTVSYTHLTLPTILLV